MARAWKWVVAALVVAGLFGLYLALRARGKKHEAVRTMADVVDAWTEPKIAAKRAELEKLKKQLGEDHEFVAGAQKDVDAAKEELRSKYQALELTPEEMEQRFKGLRV